MNAVNDFMHDVAFEIRQVEAAQKEAEIVLQAGEAAGKEKAIEHARIAIDLTEKAMARFRAAGREGKNTEAGEKFYKEGVLILEGIAKNLETARTILGGGE